jgi:hypothetical protein
LTLFYAEKPLVVVGYRLYWLQFALLVKESWDFEQPRELLICVILSIGKLAVLWSSFSSPLSPPDTEGELCNREVSDASQVTPEFVLTRILRPDLAISDPLTSFSRRMLYEGGISVDPRIPGQLANAAQPLTITAY